MAERHLHRRFGRSAAGLTWQPTALVNETLLRMIKQRQQFDNQGHFFAIATTMMERVLLDYIRRRRAEKRGGEAIRVQFDPAVHSPAASGDGENCDMEALLRALARLAMMDARKAEVARMRLIWGLEINEVAASLGVSHATVERDWRFAYAWLKRDVAAHQR